MTLSLDHHFDTPFADALARLESYNKHHYRPNTYLHKWWARRCGTTFRLILKHLSDDEDRRDYYAPGGLEGKTILDPMIGGGTTLHEAIRLGANVIGADIDPIPLLQARATLSELPLPELQTAFNQWFQGTRQALSSYYETTCPTCDKDTQLTYTLHGLHRTCPCRHALFVDSLNLRHHPDGSITRLDGQTHDIYHADQLMTSSDRECILPVLERNTATCENCGQPFHEDLSLLFYQRYHPLVVAGKCPHHGFFFAPVRQPDLDLIAAADQKRPTLPFHPADFPVQPGPKSKSLLDRNVTDYLALFSSRQLFFLHEAITRLTPLEPLVKLNLSLLLSTSLEFNAMLCGYKGSHRRRPGAIRHTFSRHAYTFPYTALENNPLYPARSSGTLQNLFHSRIVRGRRWAQNPIERRINAGKIDKVVVHGEKDSGAECHHYSDLQQNGPQYLLIQGNSASLELPRESVDFIVTDPPYFDSVQYSDLAAFFHVWLRQLLLDYVNWDYPPTDAAVGQHPNGQQQYTSVLSAIFRECRRVLKIDGRLVFTFHHWKPQGWASLTLALKRARFSLVNRYVVHAENRASVHILNQNALLHDTILVLAPPGARPDTEWNPPTAIDKTDSKTFCHQCGTMVGWMLNHPLTDSEIETLWHTHLS